MIKINIIFESKQAAKFKKGLLNDLRAEEANLMKAYKAYTQKDHLPIHVVFSSEIKALTREGQDPIYLAELIGKIENVRLTINKIMNKTA